VFAALVVGAAVAAAVPLEYQAVAKFRIPSSKSIADGDLDLGVDLWRAATTVADTGPFRPDRLRVELPELGRRNLWAASTDRAALLPFARRAAEEFSARVGQRSADLRAVPAPEEQRLLEEADRLRNEIRRAEEVADTAVEALPKSDPRVNREALLARWQGLRTDWSAKQELLARTRAETERLQAQPEPTAGIVSAEQRRKAMETDVPLQQDLRELAVRLSELRLHLLKVWQSSAGRLEQLTQAADAAQLAISAADTSKLPANLSAAVAAFSREVRAFCELLAPFEETWTAEFTALQRGEVDPHTADVLDANERVRKLLHDFLFASGQKLSAARAQLKALADDPAGSARHHVLHSNLTRAFQAVQTARHRFEFAAGTIDTPENFRLDASLRSARGLRRRTQERIESIERKLADDAMRVARQQQQQALAAAAQAVEEIRHASTQTAEQLFELHEGLVSAGQMSEEFVTGMLRAEIAAQRVQGIRQSLASVETRLVDLAEKRAALAGALRVELLSCELTGYDLQPWRRARVGLVGCFSTLLLMFAARRSQRRD
jgi:hypothetical protein